MFESSEFDDFFDLSDEDFAPNVFVTSNCMGQKDSFQTASFSKNSSVGSLVSSKQTLPQNDIEPSKANEHKLLSPSDTLMVKEKSLSVPDKSCSQDKEENLNSCDATTSGILLQKHASTELETGEENNTSAQALFDLDFGDDLLFKDDDDDDMLQKKDENIPSKKFKLAQMDELQASMLADHAIDKGTSELEAKTSVTHCNSRLITSTKNLGSTTSDVDVQQMEEPKNRAQEENTNHQLATTKHSNLPCTENYGTYQEKISRPLNSLALLVCNNDLSTKAMITTNEQKAVSSVSPATSSIQTENRGRKRSFPGPAGLLPHNPHGSPNVMIKHVDSPALPVSATKTASIEEIPCSQSTAQEFLKEPWLQMIKDYGSSLSNSRSLVEQFSVNWTIKKLRDKKLPRGRAPVLFLLIKTVSITLKKEATALFEDKTGEIPGSIHRKLVEDYPNAISPGTVIVLKQAGLLGFPRKKCHLNLTENNVVCMYLYNDVLQQAERIAVNDCSIDELQCITREALIEMNKFEFSPNPSSSSSSSISLHNSEVPKLPLFIHEWNTNLPLHIPDCVQYEKTGYPKPIQCNSPQVTIPKVPTPSSSCLSISVVKKRTDAANGSVGEQNNNTIYREPKAAASHHAVTANTLERFKFVPSKKSEDQNFQENAKTKETVDEPVMKTNFEVGQPSDAQLKQGLLKSEEDEFEELLKSLDDSVIFGV